MAAYHRILTVITVSIILCSCQSTPKITDQQSFKAGLYEVENTAFDVFLLAKPDTLNQYKAIYFAPLDLSQLQIDTRRLDKGGANWLLDDVEKAQIIRYFEQNVASNFKVASLPVALQPGANVLTAKFTLTKFTPTAPKDDIQQRITLTEIFTYHVGELELKGSLTDATSNSLVGVIEDSETVGKTIDLEKNDRFNNSRKLKNTFAKWILSLAATLNATR